MKTTNTIKLIIFLISLSLLACKKEGLPELRPSTKEQFWLRNKGADMPVVVEGNTKSNTFLIFLHGGPADGSITMNEYFPQATNMIEKDYAVAYWDQRGVGKATGNFSKEILTREQYIEDLEKLIILLKFRYGKSINIFLLGHSWGGILGQSYLIKNSEDSNIKGWIEVGSTHSVLYSQKAGKIRLKKIADEQISNNKSVEKWKDFKKQSENFCACNATWGAFQKHLEITVLAERLAEDDGVLNDVDADISSLERFEYNFNTLINSDESVEDVVLEDISDYDMANDLHKIKLPSLFLFGKYDIRTAIENAYFAYDYYGTPKEHIYIYELLKSAHSPMATEPKLFQEKIIEFMSKYND